MIDSLIRWSIHNRTIVLALAAAFLVWGGYSISKMPVDVLPDLTAPTVTILAEAPGMDPLEIESLVTFPIESALNGAAGVRRVRSATAVGVAVVWVEFDWGQDIQPRPPDRHGEAHTVSGSLPPGVEPPFLAPVSSIMGEVLFIDLESPTALAAGAPDRRGNRRPATASRGSWRLAGHRHRRRAEAIRSRPRSAAAAKLPCHARGSRDGADHREPERDRRIYGRRRAGVPRARRRPCRGRRRYRRMSASRQCTRRPVLIRDVGIVQIGAAIKRGEGSHNAKPAVIVGIQKQPGVNTLELTARLTPRSMTSNASRRACRSTASLPAGGLHRAVARQPLHRALREARFSSSSSSSCS